MLSDSPDIRLQAVARAARNDYPAWLHHVRPAAGCARPIRLAGDMYTVRRIGSDSAVILSHRTTDSLPDGVIYKPCGNRRASVCPSCSERYKRDAYQVVRAGLIGGKGVPEHVAQHPAVFPTFTAPSFGPVHTRIVRRHTCQRRERCDCRPEPCHARRDQPTCPHGTPLVCFARHDDSEARLGTPMCLDCYDHHAQVVWNLSAGELWRRTTIAINRHLRQVARRRGIPPRSFRLSFGKAAEMQRRAVVHYHAIIRLDGVDPDDKTAIVPPPPGLDAVDLVDAIDHAARTVAFTTDPHPANPAGWRIAWGEQMVTKVITVAGDGEVTDGMVAAYLAKYATKSTEVTGHASGRLTSHSVSVYADPDGNHTERLIEACWQLGRPLHDPTPLGDRPGLGRPATALRDPWTCPCGRTTRLAVCAHGEPETQPDDATGPAPAGAGNPYVGLRRWAHMLGFGGHFLTKSRTYSVTFAMLREQRIVFQRTVTAGPEGDSSAPTEDTTLVVNFLQFVGAGWHTTADALLANTSAAMAREHQDAVRQILTTIDA